MAHVIIRGEAFRVEVEGDPTKPALLLCHALGTNLTLWDDMMPALTKPFKVIRYDSRGHGGSPVGVGPYSIHDLGRDALRILDALNIETANVLGISMGGAVAQWLLAHAPTRVDRAVLACTATKFGASDGWNTRILASRLSGMAPLADSTMERWFSPAFAAREPAAVARVRDMVLACAPDGYAACCAALRDLDLHEALRGIDTPVLVVTGRDDPAITPTDTQILLQALSNARHVALDSRHIACVEAATNFTGAVMTFLTAKSITRKIAGRAQPSPRGKAAPRATAARRPLAKAPTIRKVKAKATAAKSRKPRARRVTGRSAGTAKLAKAAPAKTAATIPTPAKRPPAETRPKKTGTTPKPIRRAATTSGARGAVTEARLPAKAGKTPAKTGTKTPGVKPVASKRPPSPRRKPVKTTRRPSGRRKT